VNISFGTILVATIAAALALLLIALFRPHLTRVYSEAMSKLNEAIHFVDGGLKRAIGLLTRGASSSLKAVLPRQDKRQGEGTSVSHVLLFGGLLTGLWAVATYCDYQLTIARLSGAMGGSGGGLTADNLGTLAGFVFVATFAVYCLIWSDGKDGHTILFPFAADTERRMIAKLAIVGGVIMLLAGIFLGVISYEASANIADNITPLVFWVTFFVGAYGAVILGSLALKSVLGMFVAGLLLAATLPLWLLRVTARLMWLVPASVLWVLRVVFIDILGGVATFIFGPLVRQFESKRADGSVVVDVQAPVQGNPLKSSGSPTGFGPAGATPARVSASSLGVQQMASNGPVRGRTSTPVQPHEMAERGHHGPTFE
jgi:hypothetical protein